MLVLAGVDVGRFRPEARTVADRLTRIERGGRLRVLTVGSFSFRKGALDIAAVARQMHDRADFRFVGDLRLETRALRRECAGSIEFVPRVPEFELTRQYSWADIFLFPTIEDGFGVVVAQAQASGLPIVASAHCGGPDLITPGVNGQIVPIRSPEVILDTLLAWDRDRALLKRMTEASCEAPVARDWSDMAIDLENRFGARAVGMAAVSGG